MITKTITTQIQIQAPANRIWQILTDTASFPLWNPFIKELQGELNVGNKIKVRIQSSPNSEMTFSPKVTMMEANKYLQWLGKLGISGLFDGRHHFEIVEHADGTSTFIHKETFRGLIVPFFNTKNTRLGFEAMNKALKKKAERQ